MAIQNRRGAFANFDASKMKPGEFAIVQSGDPNSPDGTAVYIAYAAGKVRRLATFAEIADYREEIQEALDDALAEIEDTVDNQIQISGTKLIIGG